MVEPVLPAVLADCKLLILVRLKVRADPDISEYSHMSIMTNGLLIQWTSKYNNAQYFYINWPVGFSSADYIVVDAAWAVSGDRLPEEFVMAREVSRIKIGNDTWNERDARTFVIGIGT